MQKFPIMHSDYKRFYGGAAAHLRPYETTQSCVRRGRERGDPSKELFGKLVKLIPGEVIGLYLAVTGPIPKEYPLGLVMVSLLCL